MNKTPIAKVILLDNGEIHIALNNYKTVYCTPIALLELFTDVYSFIASKYESFDESTRYVNLSRKELMDISGLTLAIVYNDASIEILHPILLQAAFTPINDVSAEHMNFRDYLYKNDFTDQKQFYVKMFLEFAGTPLDDIKISRKIPVTIEMQEQMMREILNARTSRMTCFESVVSPPTVLPQPEGQAPSNALIDNPESIVQLVSVSEYALKHNITYACVNNWIRKNKLKTVTKNENGQWRVDINEPIPKRSGRKEKVKPDGRKHIVLKGNSYEELQLYIQERKLVTDKIRPYIRSYEEIQYYERNSYHEVEWNGVSYLIVNVNPEYYCERLEKTNRDLMKEGKAPVVPDSDQYVYHVHHIGQKASSPFAIIPQNIHNGKETYSIFHQGSSTDDLRTPEFEAEKKLFWRTYIATYDKYGSFLKIPYKNSKYSKDRR